jgi:hypothetical protein
MEDIINWQNNQYGATEPIQVTLDGDGDTSVGFEQAFGDYSEARGRRRERRRARRQERKLKRISRRQERKNLRQQMRSDRKARISEQRALRKENRRAMRQGGDEEGGDDLDNEEAPMPTNDTGSSEPTSGGSVAPIDDSPSPLPPSYPPTEDGSENDSVSEEDAVNNETGESDEESGFTGDYGFDGQRQPSELDVYWDNFYSSAEGEAKIHPRVKELSRRIEKNKELAKRIEARIFKINERVSASGKSIGRVDANILQSLDAQLGRIRSLITELESKLAGYSRFVGEWSNAEGGQWKENARKRAEVRQAKRSARKERQAFIKAKRKARVQELMGQMVAKGVPRKEARMKAREQAKQENPFNVTQVDGKLNAEFSPDRIEIPASTESASSFNGTGLIGLDDYNDIDAPPVRNIELDFSNASGSMKGNWKWIAIGVVVAVGGIYAYNKFIKKR